MKHQLLHHHTYTTTTTTSFLTKLLAFCLRMHYLSLRIVRTTEDTNDGTCKRRVFRQLRGGVR